MNLNKKMRMFTILKLFKMSSKNFKINKKISIKLINHNRSKQFFKILKNIWLISRNFWLNKNKANKLKN